MDDTVFIIIGVIFAVIFAWLTVKYQRYSELQKEIRKIKERERKRGVKEEAQKIVYGKVKNKRQTIEEADKEEVFEKFKNKCAVCGQMEGLHIHHKDKTPNNNVMSNLIVLCGVCHKKIHMKVR